MYTDANVDEPMLFAIEMLVAAGCSASSNGCRPMSHRYLHLNRCGRLSNSRRYGALTPYLSICSMAHLLPQPGCQAGLRNTQHSFNGLWPFISRRGVQVQRSHEQGKCPLGRDDTHVSRVHAGFVMLPAMFVQQGYLIRFTLVVGFMSNAALVMLDRNRWIERV